MLLTRDEWLKMWASIRHIENTAKLIPPLRVNGPRTEILTEVKKIKQQIESVIGQLE